MYKSPALLGIVVLPLGLACPGRAVPCSPYRWAAAVVEPVDCGGRNGNLIGKGADHGTRELRQRDRPLPVCRGHVRSANGAKLADMSSVDDEHLMVHWLDGTVEYKDDGQGPTAFMGHETAGGEVIKRLRTGPEYRRRHRCRELHHHLQG